MTSEGSAHGRFTRAIKSREPLRRWMILRVEAGGKRAGIWRDQSAGRRLATSFPCLVRRRRFAPAARAAATR